MPAGSFRWAWLGVAAGLAGDGWAAACGDARCDASAAALVSVQPAADRAAAAPRAAVQARRPARITVSYPRIGCCQSREGDRASPIRGQALHEAVADRFPGG